MNDVLIYATPLALAALGETIGQKSGVINIGLEGMMLSGAFTALVVTAATGNPWLGALAGAATGAVLAAAQSWFTLELALDQVVVGAAFNLLLLGCTSTLFRAQYGTSGALLSIPTLPKWGPVDGLVLLTIACVPLFGFVLARTKFGLATRATGEYPKSAEAAGFSVNRIRRLALLIGGACGGLAGASMVVSSAGSFAEEMTKGYGFVAIAMVTFGRWRPAMVYAASVLIGALEGLQFLLQARGVQVPAQVLLAMPYAVALVVLAAVGKGTMAPSALAIPYDKGDR